MGGSVKKAFSNPVRGLTAIGTFGTSELARKFGPVPKQLAGLPESAANALMGTHYGESGTPDIGGGGPFQLDRGQMDANQAAITGLGNQQYTDTLSAIDTNAEAQQRYAGQTIDRMLPGIYEDLNARHLLDSTALPTEIARQANNSAQDIASQVATAKLGALQGRQGFETGALQRGMSLEDFINQSNVAKSIGATMAPVQPNGKQNFGTVAQGLGALAPLFHPAAGVATAATRTGK